MKKGLFSALLILSLLLLVGCEPEEAAAPTEVDNTEDVVEEPVETAEESVEEEADVADEGVEPLAPDPQSLVITTADGIELDAMYWPASVNPAPIVVLLHQINFDRGQWAAIAPWLQGRGLAEQMAAGDLPWLDPSWFPTLPEGVKVGVIASTFRGCAGGCAGFEPEGWAEDARAVVDYAAALPESTGQVITVGTSIGADGAVNGCTLSDVCVGAVALSPGSYLGYDFAAEAGTLTGAGVQVKCFAAIGDVDSATACESFTGDLYEAMIFDGTAHGIELATPDFDVLQRLVSLLLEVVR